jgi:guanyl-specific ribonuclease Sa
MQVAINCDLRIRTNPSKQGLKMSGMIAKSQVPTVLRANLPQDVQIGIIVMKNSLENAAIFRNRKDLARDTGRPLPKLDNGCCYVEGDVGQGRLDRGERRLVMEIVESTLQIREIYFSDEHYLKGSFRRVI